MWSGIKCLKAVSASLSMNGRLKRSFVGKAYIIEWNQTKVNHILYTYYFVYNICSEMMSTAYVMPGLFQRCCLACSFDWQACFLYALCAFTAQLHIANTGLSFNLVPGFGAFWANLSITHQFWERGVYQKYQKLYTFTYVIASPVVLLLLSQCDFY